MGFPLNPDGSLKAFTTDQLTAMGLTGATALTADVRNGEHPTFELDSQGCSIRRSWFVPWEQRDNAVVALLGGVKLYGTFPNYLLSRVMPTAFPDTGYEQYVALACESVTGAKGSGKNDAKFIPAYPHAKIVCRHELVWWSLAADSPGAPEYLRYTEQLPSTTETSYLSLPGSMMKYQSNLPPVLAIPPLGYPIPYGIGRPEVMRRIAFKWRRIPYAAWQPTSPLYLRVHGDPSNTTTTLLPAIAGSPPGGANSRAVGQPYIGTVNRLPLLGYPAGFLLCEGVEEEIVPDAVAGSPCWNLTFKFLVKANTGLQGVFPAGFLTIYAGNGGHNYLYWGGVGGDGTQAGYYFAAKGPVGTWLPNGSIPDGICLFNERDHANLWKVGAVADADI